MADFVRVTWLYTEILTDAEAATVTALLRERGIRFISEKRFISPKEAEKVRKRQEGRIRFAELMAKLGADQFDSKADRRSALL